ncbi:cytochrome c oxidase subunit 5A, mitochondrial-like [Diorhabda carinulata]|uniref:cytochrome c oxidase subunit 5A, mitochondrial-like n=1 Tax=Diorhabda carinulata TaxID=1163345 RepID=UPI0025A20DCE|nr:cytochrome c oxidase subunit 5A, mitochondrial-like [Diorhabda carinulata]
MSFLTKITRTIVNKFPKTYSNNFRFISYLAVQHESIEDMISRYECIFSKEDADGWDVRQAMNDLTGYDSVPEPRIIIAGLHACRRLNDYALAVRFLEMCKRKCGNHTKTIWPYIVQEVGATVAELGCDFPESLGYDKPELWWESVFDM